MSKKIRTNTLAGIVPAPEIFRGPCTVKLEADDCCTVDRKAFARMGTPTQSGKAFHVSRVKGNKLGYWPLSKAGVYHNSGCNLMVQHGLLRLPDTEARDKGDAVPTPVDPANDFQAPKVG